jgi:hypothetical protein
VTITPSFCSPTDGKVFVRLKLGTEISEWYTPPLYQGVIQPTISATTSPIYQYEDASFSISNITTSNINSVTWAGDGIVTAYNQDTNSNLVFTKSGTITLNTNILMNNCGSPVTFPKQVVVNPSRLIISGSSFICTQAVYSINYLTNTASVTWTSSNPSIASVVGSGNTATVTKVSNGTITLTATINIGGSNVVLTKDIYFGSPSTPTGITGFNTNGMKFASNSDYVFWVQPPAIQGVNNYLWTIKPGAGTIYDGQGTSTIMVETADITNSISFYISVKVANNCGWSGVLTRNGTIDGGIGPLSIYPNPATESVTLSLGTSTESTTSFLSLNNGAESITESSLVDYDVQIWNERAGLVKTLKFHQPTLQIPLTGFTKGMYFIHIISDGKTIQKQILWVK